MLLSIKLSKSRSPRRPTNQPNWKNRRMGYLKGMALAD